MTFKQTLAIILGLGFVVVAAFQYSRPDAVFWIATYLLAAIFSFMAALGKISRALLVAAFVAYAAGALYFWPGQWLEAKLFAGSQPWQLTDGATAITLALAGLSMLLFAVLNRKKTRLHPPHIPGRIKRWAN